MKEIPLSHIMTTEMEMGFPRYWDRILRPPICLVVKPKEGVQTKPFDINIKVFEREDMEQLLEILSRSMRA
jgi:hypothetical protein